MLSDAKAAIASLNMRARVLDPSTTPSGSAVRFEGEQVHGSGKSNVVVARVRLSRTGHGQVHGRRVVGWGGGLVRIGIVVVSRNSASPLRRLLPELTCCEDTEVVMVDNASSDDSVEVGCNSGALVLPLSENTGYGRACNIGAGTLGEGCYWIGFLNPDVEVSSGALEEVARGAPEWAGAVAPLLVDERGALQKDAARPSPSALRVATRYLLGGTTERRLVRWVGRGAQSGDGRHMAVEVASGGCLLVRSEALEGVGGFDTRFFLCGEDIDICVRMRGSGWGIALDKDVTALHRKGTSTSDVGKTMRYETARATVLFFEKHGTAAQTILVSIAAVAGVVFRELAGARSQGGVRGMLGLRRRVCTLSVVCCKAIVRKVQGRSAPDPAGAVFVLD